MKKDKILIAFCIIVTLAFLVTALSTSNLGNVVINGDLTINNESVYNATGSPQNLTGIGCIHYHDGGLSCSSP